MSGCILLAGPPLRLARVAEVLLDVAPIIVGRSLALQEVERERLPDGNGGSACWRAVWRDGDVEVVAIADNGPGNPRDGYGYGLSVKLMGPYMDKPWWRAEIYGGGYEPELQSPIRIGLLGLAPETYEAVRSRVLELLPEHRDVTFDDAHAVRSLVQDFDHHGHEAWVRDFLARPILLNTAWASAALCERKLALHGPDLDTVRRWLYLAPASSRAWQALADAGGDGAISPEDASFLAALTHPFSARAIETAGACAPIPGAALAAAMAHVFHDPWWRWIDVEDRDRFDRNTTAWVPAPSRRVVVETRASQPIDAILAELFARVQMPNAAAVQHGPAITGAPLADPGALSSACGIGTGHSLRRAAIELAEPVARSRLLAVCHTNCEDRLSTFALAWFGPQAQLVLRTSLTGEPLVATRTPIQIDLIDMGDGTWAESVAQRLSA